MSLLSKKQAYLSHMTFCMLLPCVVLVTMNGSFAESIKLQIYRVKGKVKVWRNAVINL